MGASPVLAAALTAGGAMGSRLFAPQDQRFSSFEGMGSLSPEKTLGTTQDLMNGIMGQFLGRAAGTPDMSHSYVQDLPSFAGGGLPMPIGVTGKWGGGNMPPAPPPGTGKLPEWFHPATGSNTAIPRTPDNNRGVPRDGGEDPGTKFPHGGGAPPPPTLPHQPKSTGSSLLSNETGPQRLPFVAPGQSAPLSGAGPADAGGDPRALGAVSLLLKLAHLPMPQGAAA